MKRLMFTKLVTSFFFGVLIIGNLFLSPFVIYAEKLYYVAPTELPSVSPEMKTAGFWIGRHSTPDKIILSAKDIKSLNAETVERGLTKDIARLPVMYFGKDLKVSLEMILKDLSQKELYLEDGRRADEKFFEKMKSAMNLEAVPAEIPPQFGFIVRFADQRFLPREKGLYAVAGDIDFDELQNSDLDIGVPVRIFHTSKKGKWCYVESNNSYGWVKKEYVALASAKEVENFFSNPSFVVVTSPKADIFLNSAMTAHYDHVRMGSRFTLIKKEDGFFEILLPLRNEDGSVKLTSGYIKEEDASEGYLSYTARNILTQAFKLLNAPYGWGGANGEQDCSRFLAEIFSTFEIMLPRDSKDQAKAGRLIEAFDENTSSKEKLFVLNNEATSATSLLCLKGHIMLFLGSIEGRPFAIHAVWGYRENKDGKDEIRVINRVTVSDLSLGEGSQKGSLLKRLHSIVVLAK